MLTTHAAMWHQQLVSRGYGDALGTVDRSNGPQFCFSQSSSSGGMAQWLKLSTHSKLTASFSRGTTFRLRIRTGTASELPSVSGRLKPETDITRFHCKVCNTGAVGNFSHMFECVGLQHLMDDLRQDIHRIATRDKPAHSSPSAAPYCGEAIAHLIEDKNNLQKLVMARDKFSLCSALSQPQAVIRNKALPNSTFKAFSDTISHSMGRIAFELARKERLHQQHQQEQRTSQHQHPPSPTPKRPASPTDQSALANNEARHQRLLARTQRAHESDTQHTQPNPTTAMPMPTSNTTTSNRRLPLFQYLASQRAFDHAHQNEGSSVETSRHNGAEGGGGGDGGCLGPTESRGNSPQGD